MLKKDGGRSFAAKRRTGGESQNYLAPPFSNSLTSCQPSSRVFYDRQSRRGQQLAKTTDGVAQASKVSELMLCSVDGTKFL